MYLLEKTINTAEILDMILKRASKKGYVRADNGLLEVASVIFARIMYILNTRNINPRIINYLIDEVTRKTYSIFLKEIPEELCKKVKCIPNYTSFTRTIHFSGLESVIIYAKPDAFINDHPVEIKSIFIGKENSDISKYLSEIGEYQAKIYSYVFGTSLSHLIKCSYELDNEGKPIIRKYSFKTLSTDLGEIDKKVKKILKDIILPFFIRN